MLFWSAWDSCSWEVDFNINKQGSCHKGKTHAACRVISGKLVTSESCCNCLVYWTVNRGQCVQLTKPILTFYFLFINKRAKAKCDWQTLIWCWKIHLEVPLGSLMQRMLYILVVPMKCLRSMGTVLEVFGNLNSLWAQEWSCQYPRPHPVPEQREFSLRGVSPPRGTADIVFIAQLRAGF